jgi:tetratricopeptide (TPR) repeat protein
LPNNHAPTGQYALRDIRGLYPAVREDHLRYLEKLGLIRASGTRGDRYYEFADLAVIKEAAGELAQGVPFRQVLRALEAARRGQLAFDFEFRGGRTDARPARVVALERPREAPRGSANGATAAQDTPLDLPETADPHERLAAKYFLEGASLDGVDGQGQAAAAAYRRALVLDTELVPALVNLANLHYAGDELIEAQALYERALRIEPECFEAYFNLGNIHHDLGRYEDALECYQEAVGLNPSFPEAHFYLAVTLEKLGRSPDAKPHWKAYQELAPDGEWVELAKEFSE